MKLSTLVSTSILVLSFNAISQTLDSGNNLDREIRNGAIYQSTSHELYCADQMKAIKTSNSLDFEIIDSDLSYRVPGIGNGYAYKIQFEFSAINQGKRLVRATDSEMRAFGITGKVTTESKASLNKISNVTIQDDKNTVLSMLVDLVPRKLLKVVEKTVLTKDQETLNFKITRDHSDFGTSEQNCSYMLAN